MRFDKSLDDERNKKEMKELMDKSFDLFKRFPFVVVAAIVFAFSWWIFEAPLRDKGQGMENGGYQNFVIVPMTKVEATIGKGFMEVPLDLVKEKKLVSFEYQAIEGRLPLLAYVSPTGKVVTMLGVSEPCHSQSFHLEGREIVCDICFTRWDLDTLKGVIGECQANPPELIPHFVHQGRLIVKKMDVENWKPGLLRG